MTRDELLQRLDSTGYAGGTPFETPDEVRDYFTVETMQKCFGDDATDSQDDLDEMAEYVIENGLNCEMISESKIQEVATCASVPLEFAKKLIDPEWKYWCDRGDASREEHWNFLLSDVQTIADWVKSIYVENLPDDENE